MGKQFPRRPAVGAPEARDAREVIDDLLARPPRSDGELGRRLRGVEASSARREIVDRLGRGEVPSDELDVLTAAMLHVGIGDETDRLETLALATAIPRGARWSAMSLLFRAAPDRVALVLDQLTPDDRLRLMLQPAAEAARNVQAAPELAAAVTPALLSSDPDVAQLRVRIGSVFVRRFEEALDDHSTPELVDALTLAFSGALLQAGMGVITYSELGERLDSVVATILKGH